MFIMPCSIYIFMDLFPWKSGHISWGHLALRQGPRAVHGIFPGRHRGLHWRFVGPGGWTCGRQPPGMEGLFCRGLRGWWLGRWLGYLGVSINGGTQNGWLLLGKIPWKWMMTRGTPIWGNLHVDLFWRSVAKVIKLYQVDSIKCQSNSHCDHDIPWLIKEISNRLEWYVIISLTRGAVYFAVSW